MTENELIAATNALCLTVQERLPEGYEIRLIMGSSEAGIDLTSPEDEDVTIYSDGEKSGITDAIDAAITHDAIEAGEGW